MANLRDAVYSSEEVSSLTQSSDGFVESNFTKQDREEVQRRTDINPALGGLRNFQAVERPSKAEEERRKEIKQQIHEKIIAFTDMVESDNVSVDNLQATYPDEIRTLAKEIGQLIAPLTSDILKNDKEEFTEVVNKLIEREIENIQDVPTIPDFSAERNIVVEKIPDYEVSIETESNPVNRVEPDEIGTSEEVTQSGLSDELESDGIVTLERDSTEPKGIDKLNQDIAETASEAMETLNERGAAEYVDRLTSNNGDADHWAEEILGGAYDIGSSVMSSLTGLLDDFLNGDNYIMNAVADLPSFIGTILDEAIYNPVNSLINSTVANFGNMVDNVSNLASLFVDYGTEYVANYINDVKDTVQEFLSGTITETLTDKVKDLLFGSSMSSFSALKRVKVTPVYKRSYMDPKRTDSYSNLQLSNEMYWNITITPHKETRTSDSPPSLCEYFGLSEGATLPIVSYDLVGESIGTQELDLYPGLSLIFPSQLNRPSRLTITMPEFIRNTAGTDYNLALVEFKQAYVEYVFNGSRTPNEGSQAVRDFRQCAYEIEISKYTMSWYLAKKWKFLGIPEITNMIRGSAQSSVEMTDIPFTIVGEDFSEDIS